MAHEIDKSFHSTLISPRINYLESTLVEIDSAVKLFAEGDDDEGNMPSWKYPHKTLKSLEIDQILLKLPGLTMSKISRYTHLAELCIDRIYYSILITLKHLKLWGKNICIRPSKLTDSKKVTEIRNEIRNKSSDIPSYQYLHENSSVRMADLIQQLAAYFPLLEGSTLFVRKKGTTTNKVESLNDTIRWHSRVKNRRYEVQDLAVQASGKLCKYCKSCADITDIVKAVKKTLEKSLLSVFKYSSVTEAIKNDSQVLTVQLEGVTDSCNEIRFSCKSIVEKVTNNLERNIILENNIIKTKHQYDISTSNREAVLNQIRRKMFELNKKLEFEGIEKNKIRISLDNNELRCKEMKCLLNQHIEAAKKNLDEKNSMKAAKQKFDKLLTRSNKILEKIRDSLQLNKKRNGNLHTGLHTSEGDTRIEEKVLNQKSETVTDKLIKVKAKNLHLRKEISTIETQVHSLEKTRREKEIHQVKVVKDIGYLQNALQNRLTDLELLRMYPDLNGPINPPIRDEESIMVTMEQQVIANEKRLFILSQQNVKLSSTIHNLKIYFHKSSTISTISTLPTLE